MRKLPVFVIFAIILIPFTILSCDKDSEKDSEKDKVQKIVNENENEDKKLIAGDYLSKDNGDSTSLWILSSKTGMLSYKHYKKQSNGKYKQIYYELYTPAITVTDASGSFFETRLNRKPDKIKLPYKKIDNGDIAIDGLLGQEDFITFSKYTAETKTTTSILKGAWAHNKIIDSLVVVFEDNELKEYIYNKDTKQLLENWSWGKYKATEKKVYWRGEVQEALSHRGITLLEDDTFEYLIEYYFIDEETLRIYWPTPMKEYRTYKKVR